ncbi:MAG: cytochrome D1 domain-containing protein [Nitrospinota bacterium]
MEDKTTLHGRMMRLSLLWVAFVLGAIFWGGPVAQADGLYSGKADVSGLAFVANRDSNDVAVIDIAARKVVGRFPVGRSPHMVAISPDGRWVYTTGQSDDTLTVTRVSDFRTVATLHLGKSPEHLAVSPDGRLVLVGNFEDGTVSVVDARARREVARLAGFARPHNITFSRDGRRAFVANLGSDRVSVVDIEAQKIVASLEAANPVKLAKLQQGRKINGIINVTLTPDGRFGYAAHADGGEVAVIDAAAARVVKYVRVGNLPWRAYSTPDGRRMVVPNLGDRTVSVIDTASQGVTAVLPSLEGVTGVNPALGGRLAFVLSRSKNKVRVLDLKAKTVLKDIPVGLSPETASTTPDERFVFLATSRSGEVWVLDAEQLSVSAVIPNVGKHPWAVTIAGGINYCH